MILSAFENRLRAGLVYTLYKQIQPLSRIKTLNGQRVRRISPVGEETNARTWCDIYHVRAFVSSPTGLILRTLCPFDVFILLNGWIYLYSVLD